MKNNVYGMATPQQFTVIEFQELSYSWSSLRLHVGDPTFTSPVKVINVIDLDVPKHGILQDFI
jgi:hypothetical protein